MSKWTAPPNWPQPEPGWRPPPGWQPDPAWGPAPPGWKFEQAEGSWFSRHKVLTGVIGVLALLFVIGLASGGGEDDTVDTAGSSTSPSPSPSESASVSATTSAPSPSPAVAPPAPPPPAAPAPPPAAPAPPPPPAASTFDDGSFSATAPTSVKEQFDICTGTARVTNTSGSEKTAIVTFTLFKGGTVAGTLQGAASAVGAGQTATVQLLGTEPCGSGPYTFEFQVDTEF